jgi:hypothetical protein
MTQSEAMAHFMKGWMQDPEMFAFGPIGGLIAGAFFGVTAPLLSKHHMEFFKGTSREYRLATWVYFTIAAVLHFTFSPPTINGLIEVLVAMGVPDGAAFLLCGLPVLFGVLLLSKVTAESIPKFGPLVKEYNRSFFEANKKVD